MNERPPQKTGPKGKEPVSFDDYLRRAAGSGVLSHRLTVRSLRGSEKDDDAIRFHVEAQPDGGGESYDFLLADGRVFPDLTRIARK